MRPLRADVVVVPELVGPRVAVNDESIPLHDKRVVGFDVGAEFFQNKLRIRVTGTNRRDANNLDAVV